MGTNLLALDGFATKEIALQQKPINEVLKESEGMIISFTKASVKKNLTALVKKHEREITELIAKETLTVKEENRLIELRKLHKEPRIALDKITKHNSSVLAQASKHSKVVKDALTLIVEPVETKISNRLDAEETRREKAREEKEAAENLRVEKIKNYISILKTDLQAIIDRTKKFESIEENKREYLLLISIVRKSLEEKEFDLKEFEIDLETMLTTQAEAFQGVITNLTNAYSLEQSNKALEVQKLTNERMAELFDYDFKYKGEVALGELSLEEYAEILVPEIRKFRIKELLELGFEKSLQNENIYFYSPNDGLILIQYTISEITDWNNAAWITLLGGWEKEIKDYKEPTPAAEIEVVENESEQITNTITEFEKAPNYNTVWNKPENKTEVVETPIESEYEVEIPEQLGNINFSPLLEQIKFYISELAKPEDKRNLKNSEHYIYEMAVETIYGKEIWDFINERDN